MFGILGAISAVAGVVIITLRIGYRKSDNKRKLRLLVVSWIVCLVVTGVFLMIHASETYVAPVRIYRGYWYSVPGQILSYIYDFVGGEGTSPIFMLVFSPIMLAVMGAVTGVSIVAAKEKASKSATILSKIFVFIGYCSLGSFTMGIYPIYLLSKDP